ncbi:methyltransferase domain-containing protein [Paenibacillus sp. N3/727]|uniref:methyltransferase domain-containing protein n=1 Tax=Paenibacillus sp. N3/727 TaxID=2925845 RepID=UPI001F52EEA3|nr:methyltransferase domain-containing protein [Paenibacillus sp. N3/727]UNK17633.1 methyltransferase domain-containing protein [Paenibacillus sp. N3/727]
MINFEFLTNFTTEGRYQYIYTFACHESEQDLCMLELRELLGQESKIGSSWVHSERKIDPDRSPFLSARMDVLLTGDTIEEIAEQASFIQLTDSSFKVVYLKVGDKLSYDEQRGVERLVGGKISGKADMKSPDITFGLLYRYGSWLFGECHYPERAWLSHKQKPQNYSTGLSSRVARALVNIAAPDKEGVQMLDPCCGMGNVLIEALSMGLNIEGCDINPLAVRGARVNLRHYGYSDTLVMLGDMNDLQGSYNTALLDLPYNVCSVFPLEDKLRMLGSLRRLTKRAVIVSTEPLKDILNQTGWQVLGYAQVTKGTFVRDIWLCS